MNSKKVCLLNKYFIELYKFKGAGVYTNVKEYENWIAGIIRTDSTSIIPETINMIPESTTMQALSSKASMTSETADMMPESTTMQALSSKASMTSETADMIPESTTILIFNIFEL